MHTNLVWSKPLGVVNMKKLQGNHIVKSWQRRTQRDIGLVISTNWPFLGASLDGIVCCDSCGHGVIEVKCPYCVRNKHLEDAVKDKSFCLKEELDVIALDRTLLLPSPTAASYL